MPEMYLNFHLCFKKRNTKNVKNTLYTNKTSSMRSMRSFTYLVMKNFRLQNL